MKHEKFWIGIRFVKNSYYCEVTVLSPIVGMCFKHKQDEDQSSHSFMFPFLQSLQHNQQDAFTSEFTRLHVGYVELVLQPKKTWLSCC